MLEVLPAKSVNCQSTWYRVRWTHARTFENSEDGDMTKLSLELDQEMRCCILWSSSMLLACQRLQDQSPWTRKRTCIACV